MSLKDPVPTYFVFVCIRTWQSVINKNEVSVSLTFDYKVK